MPIIDHDPPYISSELAGIRVRKNETLREYASRHRNVMKIRGKASSYSCWCCGYSAAQWATIHDRSGNSPYDYVPMCHHCHNWYDNYPGWCWFKGNPVRILHHTGSGGTAAGYRGDGCRCIECILWYRTSSTK